ncbi:MAG: sensor histidine kinase [Parafilimonas sp.]
MQTGAVLVILAIIIVLIFFGVVVILVLLYYSNKKKKIIEEKLLLETQFKQQLLQSQLETQEHSFHQISQELHDNVGQLLSSAKLLLTIGSKQLPTVPDAITTAEQTIAKAIQDLRSLSKSLNSEWLHQFNLIDNLQAEKQRINAARNILVSFQTEYQKLPLEAEAQVMLFRVVQEALQNSIRHASPQHINIEIKNTDNRFELTIQDDGAGFDVESARKESLGLRNMEHRVQLLGGNIQWQSVPDKGTSIYISLPVEHNLSN